METKKSIWMSAVLAGLLIGVGGTVYLSVENKIAGSFLFGIGLFAIVTYSFHLYTGKVGYTLQNKPAYLGYLGLILTGNFVGASLAGILVRQTRLSDLALRAAELCQVKLADSGWSILILAIFCGLLMYLAVDGYRSIENAFGRCLIVFLGVMVFILCGFEHCVANMFYFSLAAAWTPKAFAYLLLMIVGNGLGALLIPAVRLWTRPTAISQK